MSQINVTLFQSTKLFEKTRHNCNSKHYCALEDFASIISPKILKIWKVAYFILVNICSNEANHSPHAFINRDENPTLHHSITRRGSMDRHITKKVKTDVKFSTSNVEKINITKKIS